jgi:RNA polymerase sigma factor (sigma-70 family)
MDIFPERLLIEKVLSGDTHAFAILVKNTERLVAQIVRKMVVNEDDQKDIVQEIYLKAFKNLSNFKFQSKLSTWIGTIAYNASVNYLEKKKISFSAIDNFIENSYHNYENIESEILRKEKIHALNNEINKLSPLYKTLLSLYHIEELSNKEISEITNLPEGTIKSYLYRARNILKNELNKNYKIFENGK